MMDISEAVAILAVSAAITFGLRALPFVASGWLQRQAWVRVLGAFLPLAIMVLLTVHSIWSAAAGRESAPWAELAAIALTVALQWFVRSPLLSIFGGAALYCAWVGGWIC